MSSTIWSRRRKQAYKEGELHADGGDDLRHKYLGDLDLLGHYDRGRSDHARHLCEQTEYHEHPLRKINNQADALASRSDNSEVRELSDMIRDLTDYLLEKESN